MAIEGLDVAEVNNLGRQLISQADQIESVINHVNALVERIPGIWRGHDATQFIDWWHSQHRPALMQVKDAVHGLGQSAINNATEQATVTGR